jgi:hypothetical protein
MNKEDESIAALVRSQSVALTQTSGTSLVRRGMQDLLAKADADQWYQRGLSTDFLHERQLLGRNLAEYRRVEYLLVARDHLKGQ